MDAKDEIMGILARSTPSFDDGKAETEWREKV